MLNTNSAFFTHTAWLFLLTASIAGTAHAQQAAFVKGKPFRMAAEQAVLNPQTAEIVADERLASISTECHQRPRERSPDQP